MNKLTVKNRLFGFVLLIALPMAPHEAGALSLNVKTICEDTTSKAECRHRPYSGGCEDGLPISTQEDPEKENKADQKNPPPGIYGHQPHPNSRICHPRPSASARRMKIRGSSSHCA